MDNPDLYTQTNLMQMRDAIEFLEELSMKLKWKGNELLLDIGCGPGNLTYNILLPFVPDTVSIVACDISEEMLKYAEAKYRHERLAFRKLDIQNMNIWTDWESNSFDKIFSFYCLHWITDQRQAVANIFDLLKDRGEAYILFLSNNPIYLLSEEVCKFDQWKKYIKEFPKNKEKLSAQDCLFCEYTNMLKDVGFKNVKTSIKKKVFWYQSMDRLMRSIEALDPHFNSIPQDVKGIYTETLKRIILEKKLATLMVESGKVKVEYTLIMLFGSK